MFAALADPTRRDVLRAVAERGPVTATALAGGLPVSRQAVAKHLGLLREAGLVAGERSGRETRFVARTGPLDELADLGGPGRAPVGRPPGPPGRPPRLRHRGHARARAVLRAAKLAAPPRRSRPRRA